MSRQVSCHRRGLALLLMLLAGVPLGAQENRWKELNQQVVSLHQQGKLAEAVPLAEEALRVAEASFGAEDPAVAASLNNLALLYKEQGRYAEAEPLYQRNLSLLEKYLGPEHPAVAKALNNLAAVYQEEGKPAEAERLYQRALAIREKALGPEHPDVASSLNNLAAVYEDEGRYGEAEPLYQRALSIHEKALGPEHVDVAINLNNLGELYRKEGRYAEAEPLLRRALSIREKAEGPEDPRLAPVLNNLGALYVDQGRYGQAEPLYLRCLRLDEKTLGAEHPSVATDLGNLALLYKYQGKYAQAEALLQRALSIDEKALGPEHPHVASDLGTLGVLYATEGKYAQAEPIFQRALAIREKALGPEHPNVATALNNLAALYDDEGKYAEAEALYQRALAVREKTVGPEHADTAVSLNNLAMLYWRQGKYAQADPLFQRGLEIVEKGLGPEHPQVRSALSNLAGLRYAQGLPQEAQPLFARAFDSLFRQFQYHFTYMSEKDRLSFLATVSSSFPAYFSFVHQYHDKMPELAGDMYDLLLWEKGFIAGSVTALRRQVEASGDPEALKLLDELAGKRAQMATLINVPPQNREAWRQQVERLQGEANELEKALVARSAAFAQQKKLERVSWQQVRDALQPGEAAVEFARFPFHDGRKWTDTDYYVALVVTPESRQPQYVVLGEGKELEGKGLVEFRQTVQARGAEAEAAALPGEAAYDLFWKPLEPVLAGKKRIYLSPDGALNQVPLGLIATPEGKLLMEEYDLRLVSSTKDLLREATAAKSKTAVLVGNPTFDLSESQQRTALKELAAPQKPEPVLLAAIAANGRSRDQGSGATLPPLPGTGAEVEAVNGLLRQHQWQAASYTGDRALEEAVKQARSPRLLHIATHGFFLPDQAIKAGKTAGDQPSGLEDPMLRSGLFFAGADRALAGKGTAGDLDDGVLTAYEATSLNLQGTELVVLSACNTGQGEVQNGEGVFGLRRALQEAGAQAVMMSLWSVPDKETQELMTRFYSKWLGGMEKHEALRRAELEERAVVLKRYGRDLPYYWGAFVLVGR
jgi:CHAT domain-containing protein/Tfp pilus assembly protein PilF